MALSKDYDLFIFDWDGTLSTSTILVRLSSFLKKRYNRGYVMQHKEYYSSGYKTTMSRDEAMLKHYAILYDLYSLFSRPRLKGGSIEVLKALKKKHKKVAVFSDSKRYRLLKEMKNLGIIDYVDFALSAASIGAYKPNPSGLLLIMERMRTGKGKSIYIGDMATDVFTAKFAGISSCAVTDGLNPYDVVKEAKPDYIFGSIGAMADKI